MMDTSNQGSGGIQNSAYRAGEMVEPEDAPDYARDTVSRDLATEV